MSENFIGGAPMIEEYTIKHDIYYANIPTDYNKNKLVLLYKDPYWLYAYWEMTNDERIRIKNYINPVGIEDFTWALKVKSITAPFKEESSFFIPVGEFASSWYIHVNQPNRIFVVEYGLLSQDYFFISAMQSNYSFTPPDRESRLWNPYYLNIFDNKMKLIDEVNSSRKNIVKEQLTSSEAYFGYFHNDIVVKQM